MTTELMEMDVVDVEEMPSVKLTPPLVAHYLDKGYNYSKIGRVTHKSPQAISAYVARHSDYLIPHIVHKDDMYLAAKSKYIFSRTQDEMINILDTCSFEQKDLTVLGMAGAVQVDKYRLLSDKSNINVSVDTVYDNMCDRDKRRKELLKELGRKGPKS